MIPKKFVFVVGEVGIGGVEYFDMECVVCERCGSLVAVERLDRHPHGVVLHEDGPREPLVKLTDPKPPVDEAELHRWRSLALEKWLHYRDNVWPSPSPRHDVARSFHSHQLAKLIPHLLGRPDLALDDTSPEAVAASYKEGNDPYAGAGHGGPS